MGSRKEAAEGLSFDILRCAEPVTQHFTNVSSVNPRKPTEEEPGAHCIGEVTHQPHTVVEGTQTQACPTLKAQPPRGTDRLPGLKTAPLTWGNDATQTIGGCTQLCLRCGTVTSREVGTESSVGRGTTCSWPRVSERDGHLPANRIRQALRTADDSLSAGLLRASPPAKGCAQGPVRDTCPGSSVASRRGAWDLPGTENVMSSQNVTQTPCHTVKDGGRGASCNLPLKTGG